MTLNSNHIDIYGLYFSQNALSYAELDIAEINDKLTSSELIITFLSYFRSKSLEADVTFKYVRI